MTYPDQLTLLLDEYLAGLGYGGDESVDTLSRAMNYSLLAGGKRIRPVLMLATAQAYGADPVRLLPTAAALEMIHTYSLIHDDLPAFDDDDLRRGQPTCHIRFGESVAILAGDALFAEAFRLICEQQSADPEALIAVVGEIAAAAGVRGLAGGQYLDVAGGATDANSMQRLHHLKTGRLIVGCVHCGGLLAAAAPEELTKLRVFASELGLLFQIKDDILDVVGETAVLGKAAGTDERLQRRTYVSVYGLQQSEEMAAQTRDRALEALAATGGDTRDLAGITHYIHERQR
ncbi:MAG: polyprenyl synthetase family protein [Thermoleophilia bacterium]